MGVLTLALVPTALYLLIGEFMANVSPNFFTLADLCIVWN